MFGVIFLVDEKNVGMDIKLVNGFYRFFIDFLYGFDCVECLCVECI